MVAMAQDDGDEGTTGLGTAEDLEVTEEELRPLSKRWVRIAIGVVACTYSTEYRRLPRAQPTPRRRD